MKMSTTAIYMLLFSCFCLSINAQNKTVKKADKVIAKFYELDDFSKEPYNISSELNALTEAEFAKGNLFKIYSKTDLLGIGYIGNAKSKTASFDYLILFDSNFIIAKSKVLIYREEYGGEIGSKRWLKQFEGKSYESPALNFQGDIIPISGATISVRSMTKAINELLQSLAFLQQKNVL